MKSSPSTVSDAGYDPYEHKVMGITAMEKALGKAKFAELLGSLVEKPQGKAPQIPSSRICPISPSTVLNAIPVIVSAQP